VTWTRRHVVDDIRNSTSHETSHGRPRQTICHSDATATRVPPQANAFVRREAVTDCVRLSPLTALQIDACVPVVRGPPSCPVADDEWLTTDFVVNSSSIPAATTFGPLLCVTRKTERRHSSPPRIHQRQSSSIKTAGL